MLPAKLTREQIKAIWDEIVETKYQRELFLREDPIRIRMSPPATEAEILHLQRHLDLPLPPSYRHFLSLSNGVGRFLNDEPLLSTQQVIELRNAWGGWECIDDEDPQLAEFVFAGRPNGLYVFCFDTRDIPEDGEMGVVVFHINGEMMEYDNFPDYLNKYLQGLERAVEKERKDREHLAD